MINGASELNFKLNVDSKKFVAPVKVYFTVRRNIIKQNINEKAGFIPHKGE